jgi:hypothetical protein
MCPRPFFFHWPVKTISTPVDVVNSSCYSFEPDVVNTGHHGIDLLVLDGAPVEAIYTSASRQVAAAAAASAVTAGSADFPGTLCGVAHPPQKQRPRRIGHGFTGGLHDQPGSQDRP